MTLAQIAWYQAQNLPSYRLDPPSLLNGSQTLDDVLGLCGKTYQ
ncbi:MAG: hypothetical protein ACLUD2_08425 [Clostridium sp.]